MSMVARQQAIPIIGTKLHRSPVAADLVYCAGLHAKLDAGRHLPLTLVANPAGFGKRTAITHWLKEDNAP